MAFGVGLGVAGAGVGVSCTATGVDVGDTVERLAMPPLRGVAAGRGAAMMTSPMIAAVTSASESRFITLQLIPYVARPSTHSLSRLRCRQAHWACPASIQT